MVVAFYNYGSRFLHSYVIVESYILFVSLNMFSFLNCSNIFTLIASFIFP
ncbi:hypothetical protein RchiOBHm_Chr2g0115031 [Rosa chinensis]|uniref:Uncharacterized protein n=1 Tax=Rosa chinensis TaxID=74649 RepID=A0A2P6RQW8_ROSCH|nr:hypothetical protein RchiOBHm_Chr2g0115031 [Rosa chinensis]